MERIKQENNELRKKIMASREPPPNAVDPEALQESEQLARDIESQIAQLQEIYDEREREINILQSKLAAKRVELGGVDNSKEQEQATQRQIALLENRLQRALVRWNESLARNRDLREQIESLRADLVVFDGQSRKAEKQLTDRKREIMLLIEQSSQAYEERNGALEEHEALEEQHKQRLAQWAKEYEALKEPPKPATRGTATGSAAGSETQAPGTPQSRHTPTPPPVAGSPTKSNLRASVAERASMQRPLQQLANERVVAYEDALRQIQAATRIPDVDQLDCSRPMGDMLMGGMLMGDMLMGDMLMGGMLMGDMLMGDMLMDDMLMDDMLMDDMLMGYDDGWGGQVGRFIEIEDKNVSTANMIGDLEVETNRLRARARELHEEEERRRRSETQAAEAIMQRTQALQERLRALEQAKEEHLANLKAGLSWLERLIPQIAATLRGVRVPLPPEDTLTGEPHVTRENILKYLATPNELVPPYVLRHPELREALIAKPDRRAAVEGSIEPHPRPSSQQLGLAVDEDEALVSETPLTGLQLEGTRQLRPTANLTRAIQPVQTHKMSSARRERIIIIGAAGRDFHNFNVYFRQSPQYEVVGFTATQIPNIEGRLYPAELSGPLYPRGLPIWEEKNLESLIKEHHVDRCILSYSDLNNQTVMIIANRCMAAGADFGLLGPKSTQLKSTKPVIGVCAVRTGCGKSQTSRYIAKLLRDAGLRTVAVRHPMPYGNLAEQRVQRFGTYEDLERHHVTFEEREEYEMHILKGTVVYAGVDYEAILREAEKEADVVIWDGGNNDFSFYQTDLLVCVADPLRSGHEVMYYPGNVNFRIANIILINKANTAPAAAIESIKENAHKLNPHAKVILGCSEVTADHPEVIRGKKVLLIDDGPTLTHGEMAFGAGKVAADKYGAAEIVDPRPAAHGSLIGIFQKWTGLGKTLPAMGYYPEQIKDLSDTINACHCDSVIIATPMDLTRLVKINKPTTQIAYDLVDMGENRLRDDIAAFIAQVKKQMHH
ncbi:putative cobalamin synthesis protein P47K [Paratrimastix pyriformis]|uniref:Cobalamin synthesis protein P47K n=1 Tax=Paratrimastix pyriformis TaxID=342808 RepID=A0ABQ8UME8_9EUKA|nr:putative cobalamin synthesis protein P47K [Paratrimastix pyriformis]